MKKVVLMAVLLTVISAVSFAGTNELSKTSKFQVVENTESRYDLYYVSENSSNVVVRILDTNGNVMNSDKIIDVKAFKRTYNLKDLPTGSYKIEVKNNEGKAAQIIFHNPIKNSSLHTIVGKLPNVNKFKVLVGPSNMDIPVEVNVYNDKGQLLMHETINSNGFSKVYDLSKLTFEYVTFELSNGKDSARFTRDLK